LASKVGHVLARLGRWPADLLRSHDRLMRVVVGVAAVGVVMGALQLTRAEVRTFASLPDAYESLATVGVDCHPPVRTDVTTGRERTLCTASDGTLAVLQVSDSSPEARAAVGDAHTDSAAVVRYAVLARQTPFTPRPVLLGDNWTLAANTAVLERVAEEYGGTIYPYPETPPGG
jgi:hypothetical protein